MKKTEKTALTAAIFAAAMCGTANTASEPVEAAAFTSTTTSVVGSEFVGNQPAISPDAIKELNSKMAPVYGPPPSYDDSDNSEEDVITTTRKITTVYGPPRTTTVTPVSDEQETTTDFVIAELKTNGQPVYGPAPFYGDVNDDGRTDVFDMILLRERFAKNDTSYSFMADVNYDLKISVADLVVLNKFLLGKIDKEEPVKTTTFEEEDVVTTIRLTTQPLYGIMTTVTPVYTDEEDIVQTTREDIQDVYGPPSWFTTAVPEDEEDTTTTSKEDDVVTETTMTQTVYGPPSWFTTTVPEDEGDVTETTETMVYPVYGPPPSWFTTAADDE